MDAITIIGLISSIYLIQLLICCIIINKRIEFSNVPVTSKNIIKWTFLPFLLFYIFRVRSIHKLLILLKDEFLVRCPSGLCAIVTHLFIYGIINKRESFKLKTYIDKNRPNSDKIWGWPIEDIESRKRWLDEHIELTK